VVPASAVPEVVDVFEKFGLTCSIFLCIVYVCWSTTASHAWGVWLSAARVFSTLFQRSLCTLAAFFWHSWWRKLRCTMCRRNAALIWSRVCAHFHFCCQLCCAERHQNYPLLLLLLIYYHHFGSSIATLWNNLKCFRHLAVDWMTQSWVWGNVYTVQFCVV